MTVTAVEGQTVTRIAIVTAEKIHKGSEPKVTMSAKLFERQRSSVRVQIKE